MSDWLMKVIRAEADRLLELAVEDDELRADLRELAESILAATRDAGGGIDSSSEGTSSSKNATSIQEVPDEPLRELTIGRSQSTPSRSGPEIATIGRRHAIIDAELAALEARCRAKAAAAHAASERQRDLVEGMDSRLEWPSLDPEMITWGEKLTDAYYWTRGSEAPAETGLSVLTQVAGCFETVADGLRLVRAEEGRSKGVDRGLQLLAEAQSALRRALQRLNILDDPDQEAAYEGVRAAAARHRIYLRRFLRADDLADPAEWPSLLATIEEAGASGRMTAARKSLFVQLRRHQELIREGKGTDRDWSVIVEVVDSLVSGGFPPSSRELRGLVIPILDDMPEKHDLPRGFRLVLREIDRYLASRAPEAIEPAVTEPTAEVKAAARLLAGKSVVVIGGSRRREAEGALRMALGLKSLLWVETKEHQSVESFEPLVARSEVALVLLAIRWSSHAFGDVKGFCDRHGKPLVRLPGGYSPNQVASQILAQCSAQLEGKMDRPGG